MKYPRNDECFCKSGKKFKKCCALIVCPVVRTKQLAEIERAIELGHKIQIRAPTPEEAADFAQGLVDI